VAIHQPHYLPWLRYIEKAARSDVFIVLDSVQFTKNGWQNRNRIKSPNGVVLLTVPVHAERDTVLSAVRIDNSQPWRRKHWRAIEQSYRKAPYFERYAPELEIIYQEHWDYLAQLNARLLTYFFRHLGITTRVCFASDFHLQSTATQRLVELVRAVQGETYYTGAYAMDTYLDTALFERAGVQVELQQWHPPIYPQLHGDFVPDLSIIDLLMNVGPDALSVLLGKCT